MEDKKIRLDIINVLKKKYDKDPYSGMSRGKFLEELKIAGNKLDRNIKYLADKGLIEVKYFLGGNFFAKITSYGIDELEESENLETEKEEIEEIKSSTIHEKELLEVSKSKQEITKDTEKLEKYFNENMVVINHPFDRNKTLKLSRPERKTYTQLFLKLLNIELDEPRLKTLKIRFLDAFENYIKNDRTKKDSLLNVLTNLCNLFEVIFKKIVYIRYYGSSKWHKGLEELIKLVFDYQADINKTESKYWRKQTIEDSNFRIVFKHKNMGSHEAWDFNIAKIEDIINRIFSTIIICMADKETQKAINKQFKGDEIKDVKDMFKHSFEEWLKGGLLIDKERLKLFLDYKDKIKPNQKQIDFLIRSAIVVHWGDMDLLIKYFSIDEIKKICQAILTKEKKGKLLRSAIWTFGTINKKQVTEPFMDLIKKCEDDEARDAALFQLWRTTLTEKEIKFLLSILKKEKNYKIRKGIIESLNYSKSDDKKGIAKSLIPYLKDSTAPVRAVTAEILGNLGNPIAIKPLSDMVVKEYTTRTTKAIIRALAKLKDKKSVSCLKKIFEMHPDYSLKQEAEEAIEIIKKANRKGKKKEKV